MSKRERKKKEKRRRKNQFEKEKEKNEEEKATSQTPPTTLHNSKGKSRLYLKKTMSAEGGLSISIYGTTLVDDGNYVVRKIQIRKEKVFIQCVFLGVPSDY